jgi:hypothetical protein
MTGKSEKREKKRRRPTIVEVRKNTDGKLWIATCEAIPGFLIAEESLDVIQERIQRELPKKLAEAHFSEKNERPSAKRVETRISGRLFRPPKDEEQPKRTASFPSDARGRKRPS